MRTLISLSPDGSISPYIYDYVPALCVYVFPGVGNRCLMCKPTALAAYSIRA